MKLLIYEWTSYLQYDLYQICKEKNIGYDSFAWKFENKNKDEKFEAWFAENVDAKQYTALLSVNYWPMLAEMCHSIGVKYIAWCYDNPLNVEHIEETLGYATNYVFLFDKVQYYGYRNAGFETVYYLPLGVNGSRLKNITISQDEHMKYNSQVSFVGSLYSSYINELLALMGDYENGYLRALMDMQFDMYGFFVLDEMVTPELVEKINAQYRLRQPDTRFQLSKEALVFAMASEVTRRNRIILLDLCSRRFDTKFYSYEKCELLSHVHCCPAVDYVKDMPKVFACSKVNLNPSLRIIQTGIPLRAFDIMGAGGFLLSNYQEELCELYENEREMVVYESMEDAIDKISFYLEHDNIREEIANRGRKKTLEQHSLQSRLEEIFRIAQI